MIVKNSVKNRQPRLSLHKSFLILASQPGPGAAREKLNEIKSPNFTFFVKQSFFSGNLFRFWKLGYLRVRGLAWVGGLIDVKRTFPELVWRSLQNLVEMGLAVCA